MDYGQKNKKETDLIRLFLSIEMSLSVSLITQNCFEKQIHRHRIHKQEKTLEVVMTSRVFGGSSGTHPLLRKVCRAALASACSHQKGPPDLSALSGFESLMQYSHAKQNSRLMATVCFGGSSGTRIDMFESANMLKNKEVTATPLCRKPPGAIKPTPAFCSYRSLKARINYA